MQGLQTDTKAGVWVNGDMGEGQDGNMGRDFHSWVTAIKSAKETTVRNRCENAVFCVGQSLLKYNIREIRFFFWPLLGNKVFCHCTVRLLERAVPSHANTAGE